MAAALILKGVSPGAALVFLLAGPATNITSLSVLLGVLGKRATALYLLSIVIVSLLCGLLVDGIYAHYGLSARALLGQAGEFLPSWVCFGSALTVLILSARIFWINGGAWLRRRKKASTCNSPCDCAAKDSNSQRHRRQGDIGAFLPKRAPDWQRPVIEGNRTFLNVEPQSRQQKDDE